MGARARIRSTFEWVRRHGGIVLMAAILLYWPIELLVPANILSQYLSWALLAIGAGVLLSFASLAYHYLRHGDMDRAGFLVMGIVVAWGTVETGRIRVLGMIVNTVPWIDDALASPVFVDFLLWLYLVGATLHIIAANMMAGKLPRGSLIGLAAGYFVAGAIVGCLGALSLIGHLPLTG